MKKDKPLVSFEELNALIGEWGETAHRHVDRFFPIRFWFIAMVALFYGLAILFWPNEYALKLSNDPVEVARLTKFLYFRGWFLICAILIACYSYLNNWYASVVLFCMFLTASVNFVFDLFNLYDAKLATPTPLLTAVLLLRIFLLLLLFVSVKNISRIPEKKDRMNIFLPFSKRVLPPTEN
ncbi:MAG: hypothetical protein EXR25_09905 [Limnohabitans sp.]|nr:hypothetical protein [Limnohabitans sp.]